MGGCTLIACHIKNTGSHHERVYTHCMPPPKTQAYTMGGCTLIEIYSTSIYSKTDGILLRQGGSGTPQYHVYA